MTAGSTADCPVRIAAVGDVHVGPECAGRLRDGFAHVSERADVLLLAGDLTRLGTADEAAVLARELTDVDVPMLAVLGNHDLHADEGPAVVATIEAAGVRVLEGDVATVDVNGCPVGVAGVKGFGGGFAGRCATEFGEAAMKAFVRETREAAERLEGGLRDLEAAGAGLRIALMHYSPIPETLQGEPPEIFPFLGSFLLGEAVDRAGADLVLHGHAHRGTERGTTPGGVRVRNVAQPVIQHSYRVYVLHADGVDDSDAEGAPRRDRSRATDRSSRKKGAKAMAESW